MLCNKYDGLMMKYMDGALDLGSEEELALKAHIGDCAVCAEDFAAYSEILKSFEKMEIVEPPAEFAAEVMQKVVALELYKKPRVNWVSAAADVLAFAAWVLALLVFAGGAALGFFGAEIFAAMEGAGLYGLIDVLAPAADFAASLTASFTESAGSIFNEISQQSMIMYSLSLLVVFVGLVVLQINMNTTRENREKVKNYG